MQPAIDEDAIDFLGELGPEERDPLYAGALATVMLGRWPEPFGLVAIESMATGTPVIARRAGALVETVIHGETGFVVDDVGEAALAVEPRPGARPAADPRAARSSGSRRRGWPTSTRRRTGACWRSRARCRRPARRA